MRDLARVRSQAAKLKTARPPNDPAMALIDDALALLDTLRVECSGLQQRCTELEARLRQRAEAERLMLDTLPQPIVATDAAGVIVDANRAACSLLARSRPRLTNDLLLHFAEDRAAFSSVVRELPHASDPIVMQARFRPSDRAPFTASVTIVRDVRRQGPEWLWVLSRES
jgi:PAS domain-containing protein